MKKKSKKIDNEIKILKEKIFKKSANLNLIEKKRRLPERLRRIYTCFRTNMPLAYKSFRKSKTSINLVTRFCVRLSNLISKNSSKTNGERFILKILNELKFRKISPKKYLGSTLVKHLPTLAINRGFIGRRKVVYPIYLNLDRSTFFFVSWIRGSLKVRKELPGFRRVVDDLVALNRRQGNLYLKKEALNSQVTEAIPFINNKKSRYKFGRK